MPNYGNYLSIHLIVTPTDSCPKLNSNKKCRLRTDQLDKSEKNPPASSRSCSRLPEIKKILPKNSWPIFSGQERNGRRCRRRCRRRRRRTQFKTTRPTLFIDADDVFLHMNEWMNVEIMKKWLFALEMNFEASEFFGQIDQLPIKAL